ncbi:hypothetical protein Tco_0770614 [Tanacetum coccineum]|uniref:Uncharacterized protein n=1 Tax=Tanacetum coccineum TaxID=301880 RepID=A0ABQ4ZGE9_9ASTR
MVGVDVDTLTMEQYLALSRETQAPGVVKPEIKDNVNFEIKSQFMRELKEDTFSRNKDEDANDYIDWVLSNGPIPKIRPTQALNAIQTMANHSQKWHDKTTSRNIESSSSKDKLAALVGCQIYEGPHLDKDCPLNEEVKQVEEETSGLNKLIGVSFISGPESDTPEVLQHQLPPKELNPIRFTLPCMIGKFNFYAMADLGVDPNP